jgi:branched-chain amino acid transport system substrate-binding protein
MLRSEKVTRRGVLRGAAGLAAAGTIGFPGILRAQDVLKFGHLTPLTGFLGPLGEFAQMGVKLALEEVNGAGRDGPQDRTGYGGFGQPADGFPEG